MQRSRRNREKKELKAHWTKALDPKGIGPRGRRTNGEANPSYSIDRSIRLRVELGVEEHRTIRSNYSPRAVHQTEHGRQCCKVEMATRGGVNSHF